ncbi:alpha-D-xyloside xylohydrolase [Fusarium oxysporum f. sp. lycopersici 4287]|uniref:Alpha-D-xyloside xylohydrolase n=2 Tax=Fusarium oxysporum TaxID=5507 RepID=A0A0J9WMY2_FUSO4|nr:alpha-D-xyloside xylohydrolase [Fusarium oxysporum f. sp. lycopersici 4287]KNB06327.1 alpha-D-xyloside xylohydrolase [Fusarium oxysporum f. sp. lycopersici 4287]
MSAGNWALDAEPRSVGTKIIITENEATLTNGKITARISKLGKIIVENAKGQVLLKEYARNRRDLLEPKCSALEVEARKFQTIPGTENYHLTVRLESLDPAEKVFGMGQDHQLWLDLKGHSLELAYLNSQASVPFVLSSLGYGFLWNNPAVGRAVFGKNVTTFEAYAAKVMDYWIVAGDTSSEILGAYAGMTGSGPLMPECGFGF